MESYPEKIDSKFRFVLLAAHRAEQLIRGAQPKLTKPDKMTSTAMREVTMDLLEWDYGPAEALADEDEDENAGSES